MTYHNDISQWVPICLISDVFLAAVIAKAITSGVDLIIVISVIIYTPITHKASSGPTPKSIGMNGGWKSFMTHFHHIHRTT